jgi:hypothetical protein
MDRDRRRSERIRGDKLVLATVSILRTLVVELDKAGAINISAFLAAVDDTVTFHRAHGDPNALADAIEAIATHLREFGFPRSLEAITRAAYAWRVCWPS